MKTSILVLRINRPASEGGPGEHGMIWKTGGKTLKKGCS